MTVALPALRRGRAHSGPMRRSPLVDLCEHLFQSLQRFAGLRLEALHHPRIVPRHEAAAEEKLSVAVARLPLVVADAHCIETCDGGPKPLGVLAQVLRCDRRRNPAVNFVADLDHVRSAEGSPGGLPVFGLPAFGLVRAGSRSGRAARPSSATGSFEARAVFGGCCALFASSVGQRSGRRSPEAVVFPPARRTGAYRRRRGGRNRQRDPPRSSRRRQQTRPRGQLRDCRLRGVLSGDVRSAGASVGNLHRAHEVGFRQ